MGDSNFDIVVGSFYWAEDCELVGLLILKVLEVLGLNLGLDRDDKLGLMQMGLRQCEKMKEKMSNILKTNGLKITIEMNMNQVKFLDMWMSCDDGLFRPFIKENNIPRYVNINPEANPIRDPTQAQ